MMSGSPIATNESQMANLQSSSTARRNRDVASVSFTVLFHHHAITSTGVMVLLIVAGIVC